MAWFMGLFGVGDRTKSDRTVNNVEWFPPIACFNPINGGASGWRRKCRKNITNFHRFDGDFLCSELPWVSFRKLEEVSDRRRLESLRNKQFYSFGRFFKLTVLSLITKDDVIIKRWDSFFFAFFFFSILRWIKICSHSSFSFVVNLWIKFRTE